MLPKLQTLKDVCMPENLRDTYELLVTWYKWREAKIRKAVQSNKYFSSGEHKCLNTAWVFTRPASQNDEDDEACLEKGEFRLSLYTGNLTCPSGFADDHACSLMTCPYMTQSQDSWYCPVTQNRIPLHPDDNIGNDTTRYFFKEMIMSHSREKTERADNMSLLRQRVYAYLHNAVNETIRLCCEQVNSLTRRVIFGVCIYYFSQLALHSNQRLQLFCAAIIKFLDKRREEFHMFHSLHSINMMIQLSLVPLLEWPKRLDCFQKNITTLESWLLGYINQHPCNFDTTKKVALTTEQIERYEVVTKQGLVGHGVASNAEFTRLVRGKAEEQRQRNIREHKDKINANAATPHPRNRRRAVGRRHKNP